MFNFLFSLNTAAGSVEHFSLPIDSSCEVVRDGDNWRMLSGGISCTEHLCPPVHVFGCNICSIAEGK